jgi:hypothetical protein
MYGHLGPKVLERNGDAMVRLADDYRRSVVFLGFPDPSDPDHGLEPLIGTGFFVGYKGNTYLVTAGHVADALKIDPLDVETGPFGIRFNDLSVRGRVEPMNMVQFHYHPDYPTIDVAVAEYAPPRWADALALPQARLLDAERMEQKDIGCGDLAYVVGLFHLLRGKERNLPVVHTGHIAALPGDELIETTDGTHLQGYIVEANAIGGASGSPVFARRSWEIGVPNMKATLTTYGAVFVFGLWVGAWNERVKVPAGKQIPRGLGIVAPTSNIIEALNVKDLVDRRKERRAKAAKDSGVKLARASSAKNDKTALDGNLTHKEDFTSLLNEAAQRREPKD